jgi:transcriptional/translational regulatory protein YebC/TACO1
MPGTSRWANIRRRASRRADRRLQLAARTRGAGLESVRYEGYAPGGAAVMIDCLTRERGRLELAVRRAFLEHGGRLGAAGSVSYLFKCVGVIYYPPGSGAAALTRIALEAGAEEVVENADTSVEVLTDPVEFAAVQSYLTQKGFVPAIAEVTWRAAVALELAGEAAEQMLNLLRTLEGLEEICDVYSNAEIAAA